jgi:hypothetical protein
MDSRIVYPLVFVLLRMFEVSFGAGATVCHIYSTTATEFQSNDRLAGSEIRVEGLEIWSESRFGCW